MTINGLSERRDDFVVITLLKGNLITSGERLKVPPVKNSLGALPNSCLLIVVGTVL